MLHSLERKFKPVVHIDRFQVSCELCGKGLWCHHNRSMRAHLFYPSDYRPQGQLKTARSLTLTASGPLLLPHQPHKHRLQEVCQSLTPPCHFSSTLFPDSFPRPVFSYRISTHLSIAKSFQPEANMASVSVTLTQILERFLFLQFRSQAHKSSPFLEQ